MKLFKVISVAIMWAVGMWFIDLLKVSLSLPLLLHILIVLLWCVIVTLFISKY